MFFFSLSFIMALTQFLRPLELMPTVVVCG
uniref:Uncharacterized protein n=1 Tax=Lotus japonicus TaxID=34305 RepID=I3SX01_LOTJA|nr:unknown [Lotus japonicus]